MNPRKTLKPLAFICLIIPGISQAVTEEDFKAKTSRNLINLCTVATDDPDYIEAIHFCHGYLVGAYDYHLAEHKTPQGGLLVCLPDPKPARNIVIKKVISWMQEHPEYMNEIPVETGFRALVNLWPCKK